MCFLLQTHVFFHSLNHAAESVSSLLNLFWLFPVAQKLANGVCVCVCVCGGGIVVPGRKLSAGSLLFIFFLSAAVLSRGISVGALLFKCPQTTA